MFEITPREWEQIDPSVRALLVEFNHVTRAKLELAPKDSRAIYENRDGVIGWVGADGWVCDSDADPDEAETRRNSITVDPARVRDTETP